MGGVYMSRAADEGHFRLSSSSSAPQPTDLRITGQKTSKSIVLEACEAHAPPSQWCVGRIPGLGFGRSMLWLCRFQLEARSEVVGPRFEEDGRSFLHHPGVLGGLAAIVWLL